MISRVFGKATNTISINNIEFHNCKEVLIESNLKEAVVKLNGCTLNKSCLNFNFSKDIKETEIMISNSSIINCNCSDGIVQISSTPTVRTHFHSNITFHNVSVTDNLCACISGIARAMELVGHHCTCAKALTTPTS